jgi:beta-glucosidase
VIPIARKVMGATATSATPPISTRYDALLEPKDEEHLPVSRVKFPQGFLWGAATAAYQIEGAASEDDKGESIWDRFAHPSGHGGGDRGCQSYRRAQHDLALLREMNLGSYRFSISWPRIFPNGRPPLNPSGIDYYGRIVDGLLTAGIRPIPTLYHWDLPQALQERGGWPERDTAGRFADYADAVARALGDRVRDWILFDEPGVFTRMGYLHGTHAPGIRDRDAFLRATHVVNLAQAEGWRALRSTRSDARVGTAYDLSRCEPAGDADADAAAAERAHRFHNLWFLEPPLRGRYPEAFVAGTPLDRMDVRPGDMDRVRAPLDFIGVSFCGCCAVSSAAEDAIGIGAATPDAIGDSVSRPDFGWESRPDALYDVVMFLTREFERPVLEITGSGRSSAGARGSDGAACDARRTDFHRSHLAALARAIEDGADVRSYHVWSLLDHCEWSGGGRQRPGPASVNPATADRALKESGRWYGRVAAENAVEI